MEEVGSSIVRGHIKAGKNVISCWISSNVILLTATMSCLILFSAFLALRYGVVLVLMDCSLSVCATSVKMTTMVSLDKRQSSLMKTHRFLYRALCFRDVYGVHGAPLHDDDLWIPLERWIWSSTAFFVLAFTWTITFISFSGFPRREPLYSLCYCSDIRFRLFLSPLFETKSDHNLWDFFSEHKVLPSFNYFWENF